MLALMRFCAAYGPETCPCLSPQGRFTARETFCNCGESVCAGVFTLVSLLACVQTQRGRRAFRLAMAVSRRSRFPEGKWARDRVVGCVTSTSDGSDDEHHGLAKRKKGGREGGGAGGTAGKGKGIGLGSPRGVKTTAKSRLHVKTAHYLNERSWASTDSMID